LPRIRERVSTNNSKNLSTVSPNPISVREILNVFGGAAPFSVSSIRRTVDQDLPLAFLQDAAHVFYQLVSGGIARIFTVLRDPSIRSIFYLVVDPLSSI
jgi:hypothetical protein